MVILKKKILFLHASIFYLIVKQSVAQGQIAFIKYPLASPHLVLPIINEKSDALREFIVAINAKNKYVSFLSRFVSSFTARNINVRQHEGKSEMLQSKYDLSLWECLGWAAAQDCS